ncbi:Aliphatic (R)-hydroxynitrile lyase [Linum perenne]
MAAFPVSYAACPPNQIDKNGVITCKAIVLKEAKKEGMSYEDTVEVKEIQVDPPQNVEIRVKMLCASVCRTDILTIEGFMAPTQFPKVNGHEGVGIIESVGPEVTDFKVGDMILAPTYGECQVCSSCKSNRTNFCQNYGANESALEPDGTSRFSYVDECGKKQLLYYKLGCSTWTEYMVVDSNYAANLNGSGLPAPHLSIMSCAFATGYGAVWLDAKVQEGDSVAIFGVGSVGISAVIAAKELKAKQIIVIDRNQTKLDVAMELGATHYINSAELPGDVTVSEKVRELTPNKIGVDASIESSGYDVFMNEAMKAAIKGKAKTVITGEGFFEDDQIRFDFKEFLFGGNVVGNVTGRVRIHSDLPSLLKKAQEPVIRAGMDKILGYDAKTKTCKYQVDIRGGTAEILKGLNEYVEKDDCIKLVIKLSDIDF